MCVMFTFASFEGLLSELSGCLFVVTPPLPRDGGTG